MAQLLPGFVFDFLIVFVRITSAVMLIPGFSESGVTPMIRVGLSIALTTMVAPLVAAQLPAMPQDPTMLIVMILVQIVVGLSIGWLTQVILVSLPMAGQILSYQIGLSSVLLPSTELGSNSTLVSSVFNLMVPVLFFGTSMIVLPLLALSHSFQQIPVDFLSHPRGPGVMAGVIRLVVRTVAAEFVVALQIAGPFLVIGMIWQAGLGLMARAAPQLQIFFVAAPLQILAGLILLAVFLGTMLNTWQHASGIMLRHYVGL